MPPPPHSFVSPGSGSGTKASSEVLELDDLEDQDKTLHIKGQMIFVSEWQQMLFLACPMMKGLNNLLWSGNHLVCSATPGYDGNVKWRILSKQTSKNFELKRIYLSFFLVFFKYTLMLYVRWKFFLTKNTI